MLSKPSTDLRAIAAPLAVLAPIAITLGNVVSEAVAAAIGILFLMDCIQRRDFAWVRQPWFAALLLLWAYSLLRTLIADANWGSMGASLAWVRFILFAAALAVWLLPDETVRRRMTIASIVAVSFMASDALLQYITGHDIIGRPWAGNRLTAEFPRPYVGIEIAWMFLPPLMALLAWRRYWGAALFCTVVTVAVLLTGERVAFLVCLTCLAAAAVYLPEVRRWALIVVPVAAVGMAALFIARPAIYQRQVASTLETAGKLSESHYGIIWASALRMAEAHPVFGVGVRNYATTCLDPAFGPEISEPSKLPRCANHPHNNYLEWLTETGAIGLALYVAAVVSVLAALGGLVWRGGVNPVLCGTFVILAIRFWPLQSNGSFYIAWSAIPMFLMIGWGLSYRAAPEAGW